MLYILKTIGTCLMLAILLTSCKAKQDLTSQELEKQEKICIHELKPLLKEEAIGSVIEYLVISGIIFNDTPGSVLRKELKTTIDERFSLQQMIKNKNSHDFLKEGRKEAGMNQLVKIWQIREKRYRFALDRLKPAQ